MDWKASKADEALKQYVVKERNMEVQVKLRGGPVKGVAIAGTGRIGMRGAGRIVTIAAASCVVLGLFVLVQKPQKIYGYVNDVPLTSKVEARAQAKQMFDDLAVGMAPAEDVLGSLFSL